LISSANSAFAAGNCSLVEPSADLEWGADDYRDRPNHLIEERRLGALPPIIRSDKSPRDTFGGGRPDRAAPGALASGLPWHSRPDAKLEAAGDLLRSRMRAGHWPFDSYGRGPPRAG
jgi:hypothetical protein